MKIEVQWFVSALIENELITLEDAVALDNGLGGNSELGDFAQTFLDQIVEGMSEEDMNQMAENIQQLIDYAVEQAATGELPALNRQPGTGPDAPASPPPAGKLPDPRARGGARPAPPPAAPAVPEGRRGPARRRSTGG